MADRRIQLEQGKWWAGFTSPFFVSDSMIVSQLRKYGVTNVQIHDRDDEPPDPSLPLKADPHYNDNWEQWVEATYVGPPRTLEIPFYSDHISWLLHVPLAHPTSSAVPVETATGAGTVFVLLVLWYFFKD